MGSATLTLTAPNEAAFEPFGQLILPPDKPGQRRFYSDALRKRPAGSEQVLHVNHVLPSTLPLAVTAIERHPQSAQGFFPIDVSRYAVLVAPSDEKGDPVMGSALAFLMPGTMGVIFHPNVWHLGATVFDRTGHFTVLMNRGGPQKDDEFRNIAPLRLVVPNQATANNPDLRKAHS